MDLAGFSINAKVYELTAPRTLRLREQRLDPLALEPAEILCETVFSALSVGTELAAWRGDPPLRPGNPYPRVIGYCNVAQILRVGASVTNLAPGQHVLTFQSHRSAFSCNKSDVIAALPSDVDLASASTTYLFHLGYNALLRCSFVPGHRVAVVGLGTIGLATVALASRVGGTVHAFSNRTDAQRLAANLGAHGAWDKRAPEALHAAIQAIDGGGFDIVITTSSEWSDWKTALKLVRKGGTIGVVGFPGRTQPEPPFNPLASEFLYDKQLTIIGCGQSPDYELPAYDLRFTVKRNCTFLLDLILRGELPARRLIASVEPWDRLESIYNAIEEGVESGLTRVLLWK